MNALDILALIVIVPVALVFFVGGAALSFFPDFGERPAPRHQKQLS